MPAKRKFLFVFILTAIVYGLLAIFSYSDIIFHFELSRATSFSAIEVGKVASPVGRDALLLLLGAALLYLYVQGFLLLKNNPISKPVLLVFAAVLTAIAFFTVPFDSTDVCVYINHGWLQTHYHLNPYATSVADLPNWYHDAMLKQHWIQAPCAYGPAFALLCKVVTQLGAGNYVATLFVLKAVNALCHLGIAYMILFGIATLQDGEQSLQSAYLYAFSPFMLMHEVVNAHNEIVMAFFTCLALVLWLNRKYLPVFFSFFIGVAIKYACLVTLPGFVYLMIKRCGVKKTSASLLLGLIPVAALFYVYISPMDSSHLQAMVAMINQPCASLRALLGVWHVPVLDNLLAFVIAAACLLVAVRSIYRWTRQSDESKLTTQVISDMVLFQILLVCLVSAKLEAWYPALFFPLAMFLPAASRVRQFSLVLTGLLIFSILWFGFPGTFMMPVFLFLSFVASKVTTQMDHTYSNFSASG